MFLTTISNRISVHVVLRNIHRLLVPSQTRFLETPKARGVSESKVIKESEKLSFNFLRVAPVEGKIKTPSVERYENLQKEKNCNYQFQLLLCTAVSVCTVHVRTQRK